MTTKYRITFADGRQSMMLDMEGRGLDYARHSVAERFGKHRVRSVDAVIDPPPGENHVRQET